jgi:hypothetical protein
MANASFYRLKYKTINIVANYWFGGLTNVIDNIIIWTNSLYENCRYLFKLSNPKRMGLFELLVKELLILQVQNDNIKPW